MSASKDLENVPVPVSVVREIYVRPGKEQSFEREMNRLAHEAVSQPGHLGATVVRPATPTGPYRFIYKFDGQDNLQRWHASDVRARLWSPVAPLIVAEHLDTYEGLETWFDFPTTSTPPKWKTTLVSWLAIYPVALAVSYTMILVEFEAPPAIRTLVLTAVVVPVVAYLVAPHLSHLLHGWLHDNGKNGSAMKRYVPEQEGGL